MSVFYDVDTLRETTTPVLIHQLFEQAVRQHADRTAVVFGEETITYHQLNEKADKLCQTILYQHADAELIGLSTTRSLEMVVGLLAILKAGKAYLPLDPAYPAKRIQQMVADPRLSVCVSKAVDASVFDEAGLQCIIAEADHTYTGRRVEHQSQLACVLYTSGTTGKPKGVCLNHAALVNLLRWQENYSIVRPGLHTLQFCHLSFDASILELFVPLMSGGTVFIIDDTLRLDAGSLLNYIEKWSIHRLFLPFVTLQYLAEAAVAEGLFPACLLEVETGGELLKITPQIARFFTELRQCILINGYGPTEGTLCVTALKLTGDVASWPQLPTIGTPITNVAVYILDEQLQLSANGDVGELCISGTCLASGYLYQPELTAEKFLSWTHPEKGQLTIYRTGDMARQLPSGEIEFHGRRDDQVKIRGNRVELGEIEVALSQQPAIQQAVVVAREDVPGQKRLVAYLVASQVEANLNQVRKTLEQQLPDFMIPSYFIVMDELPKTTSGKVDKKQLPKPDYKRPELAEIYKAPSSVAEKQIAALWMDLLQLDKVGVDDNFFELGGSSLLAQKTVAALKGQFDYVLPITKLYQYPTVAGIAMYLQQKETAVRYQTPITPSKASADVAVIGMAGRFPGAATLEELWDVLAQGKETTRFFTSNELDASLSAAVTNDPAYVKARGIIEQADQFDAAFFGLNPTIAELMDPQQRIFLEIAWEALEKTGYLPQAYQGRVGVYAGCGNNTYYLNNVQSNRQLIDQVGSFQVATLNEKDYIASRTAYQLNLKGPAVSVYSACSTSLLAIAQAVESIRKGQCDVALAGGASITAPVNSGHLYQEGAMFSQDGHCRSFDADASGTVFSDGAGVVLLKSLEAAKRDGDVIYAVIKGVGVNNDGSGKGSFMAPNAEGQAGAIRMAIDEAQIDPATISYIEAHGTATPLGDPIEIEGLTMAFGEQSQKRFCAIGSIKSNMGHLTAAAGVAGFIKTTLALYYRQIPASLGFETPNPVIDFANSPFFVNTQLTDWPSVISGQPTPRRAGVSSFGVGGTNVHVMLEEHMAGLPVAAGPVEGDRPMQLMTWSAKSAPSLDNYAGRLTDYLRQTATANLADVAFTLQTTRPGFMHRRFVLASDASDALATLAAPAISHTGERIVTSRPGEVVFLFPGQGAQYLNMGRGLYEQEAVYRAAIDECAALLQPYIDTDIRQVIYPETINAAAKERLKNTRYTQPALFVTEYALARLWMSWGIEPTVFCGHSIGEFVGAHLAGIFTLADALLLVAARGRMVSELPRGSMLSIRMDIAGVQAILPETLSVAAINSQKLCVVAGADEEVAAFARLLDEREVPNRVLETSHAFHSAMMDPIVADFGHVVQRVSLNRPRKPIVSTVTGTWLTDAQATDPQYWATHLRLTVRFADALETLFNQSEPLLLEVGPGNVTTTLARQQATGRQVAMIASLDVNKGVKTDHQAILSALGQVWLQGLDPDWHSFYGTQKRNKVVLPTYAFNRKRCWVAPVTPVYTPVTGPAVVTLPVDSTATIHLPTISMRKEYLLNRIKTILENASGIEMQGVTPDMSFLEIGLDSLLLTQVALTFKKEFNLPITFRQLNEEHATLDQLAAYLDQRLPAEPQQPQAPVYQPVAQSPNPAVAYAQPVAMPPSGADSALSLIAQQLQLLARQVALLEGNTAGAAVPAIQPSPAPALPSLAPKAEVALKPAADLTPEEVIEIKKPFGATARIERHATELSSSQQLFLEQLTNRYNQKTASSKAYAQQHRRHMADPRVVSGFKPLTKELVYPIVVKKSQGSRLWDIDGNEYIDALNGFGSNMLGYQPDVIRDALHKQVDSGYEVGPQHELAGEVTDLICEFTGFDRAALCSTGSEAVLGAMRIARTVTGRSLIVAFTGSYHGIVDEVIVRGTKKLKSFPAASGIMPESVQNMLILDYGTDESLQIIRERAHELAAVLVEPIQSRRPEFRPVEFLKQVRTITADAGTALIFDEVITGFRMHPGGAQALFGVKADLASYGKVVGGGVPIGVIAGVSEFMDALDGGFWQYGDASFPEVGVTYFAGTFVRHPLALAAAKASLDYMKAKGPDLQKSLTAKAERLTDALNTEFSRRQLPFFVAQFGSLWKIKFHEEVPYSELLFTLMREKGIHIWDGFPCFMTEAHTADDISRMISSFVDSVDEMIKAGFFKASRVAGTTGTLAALNQPPTPGARLGRDKAGNPAWFISDPGQPGNYLQLELK